MAEIQKGKVSTVAVDTAHASVTPYNGGIVTPPLVVPFYLIGAVPVGTEVAYTIFEDNTGVILCRMDGGWNHSLQEVD